MIRLLATLLLGWAQVGYGLALEVARRLGLGRPVAANAWTPHVTLVIAAHAEGQVIDEKVRNALALDYPRSKLRIVVACDGSPDDTPALARAAGADEVLELPWGGKVAAQDAAVRAFGAGAEVLAFSDANAFWQPDALRQLVQPLADPQVGYVCGQVSFVAADGTTNQEGLYWRYELWLRARESALASVTAGNGAIYAVRPSAYVEVDPVMGHDLKFPFTLVRDGWRCVYAPDARATERMVPTVEGEGARKRRMMSHAWAIVLRGGLLDPRGFEPRYLAMLVSHRWLRYVGPFLHLLLPLRLLAPLLGAAAAGGRLGRPGLVARYYVLTQAAIAQGLVDHLRHGTEAGWSPPEGTRDRA